MKMHLIEFNDTAIKTSPDVFLFSSLSLSLAVALPYAMTSVRFRWFSEAAFAEKQVNKNERRNGKQIETVTDR